MRLRIFMMFLACYSISLQAAEGNEISRWRKFRIACCCGKTPVGFVVEPEPIRDGEEPKEKDFSFPSPSISMVPLVLHSRALSGVVSGELSGSPSSPMNRARAYGGLSALIKNTELTGIIIDNSSGNRKLLARQLINWGFKAQQIYLLTDGDELQKFLEDHPDLRGSQRVVTFFDFTMDRTDGAWTIKKAQELDLIGLRFGWSDGKEGNFTQKDIDERRLDEILNKKFDTAAVIKSIEAHIRSLPVETEVG